jgi:hypothetical protein
VEVLVKNKNLVEAMNLAEDLAAKRQECFDKSLQVDDFDGAHGSGK